MSRSHRSFDFDNEMMHHILDMDSSYKPSSSSSQQKKHRMKRMEELSHSLDDGLNDLPDDYGRHQVNRGRQPEPHYNDFDYDNEDFFDDDYIDDYYYNNNNNNAKAFDARPKSYNEKYGAQMYDDYDAGNFNRNRYSLNETSTNKSRYQQSPVAQQKHPTLRRQQGPSGSSGNGHHGSNKHILFNDEDDVHYMSEKKSKSASSSTKSAKKDLKKEFPPSSSSLFSMKKKPSKEDLAKPEKSAQQVMKAKLKIHNMSSDDSVLNARSNHKLNALHRHHSVDSKLPSHGPDRSNMSPTIMEEIEFEMQDVETETDKEVEKEFEKEAEKVKEKPPKDKSKEKKGDSAPSTPTTKKSFKAHLSNHKKLFKVPDIDLNKFSCFFSSNKNIAALKGSKKSDNVSKSAEALNLPSPKASPKNSPTTKTPPASPKKIEKNEPKIEKVEEKFEKVTNFRNTSRTTGSGSTIQSSSECFKEEENSRGSSDTEFESQAMKVVRTVGQAFEVCHKLSLQKKQENNDDISEINSELDQSDIQNMSDFDEPKKALDTTPILQDTPKKLQRPNQLENLSTPLNNLMAPPSPNKVTTPSDDCNKENSRECQILKEQVQQQTAQTKQALAQLILVREQLLTETNARIEAQARTQQLLQQNRELLEHIASLSGLNEAERPGLSSANIGMAPQSQLPLYLQTLSLLGSTNPSNIMQSQKQNDYEDIKNNNSPNKMVNHNGNLGAGLNLESFQIFQNTMQAYNQLQKLAMPQQHQELYQLNQELLNRLKNLNIGFPSPTTPVGAVTTLESDGKIKVIVPVEQQRERERYRIEDDFFGDRRSGGSGGTATLQRPPNQQRALTPILSRGEKKSQGNTVTLKVTDEAGNITRKLPAQPSFITRSTSEKVPNRSQMMNHVQRTQWARHTTK